MTATATPETGQASTETALATTARKTTAAVATTGAYNYPSADIIKERLDARNTPREHVDSILWMLEFARSNKLNQGRLGALLGYEDGTVVSRVLSATYPEHLMQGVIDNIDGHRRLLAQETMGEERPICETWVLREIASFCHMVRKNETVGFLYGRSHTGKTVALQEYKRRNNHGRTIYVRMPPGGAPRMFLLALARACNISERNAYDQLRDRLIRFFKPDMLLLVDEVHQTLIGRKLQAVTLEVLRDLHDIAGCGLVLCGTPVFAESVNDEKVGKFLEQLDNRATIKRRLPDTAPWADVQLILGSYGLPPVITSPEGEKIVRAMIKSHGLGKLTKFLMLAREAAKKRKEVFAWNHVIGTDAMLKGWERGDGPKEQEGGN